VTAHDGTRPADPQIPDILPLLPIRDLVVFPYMIVPLRVTRPVSMEAVAKALRDVHVPPQNVWVVYDELDLPLCRMRIRRGGSGAGHNGVLSLISSLGTPDFVRFRVGIGKPARKGSQPGRQYVLGRFTKAEAERVPTVIDGVASALELALGAGVERAMDRYNRAGSLGCEELA